MDYSRLTFIKIDINYIKKLYFVDNEVFYNSDPNYDKKPYLGILINNDGREYAIPLTSAKSKHAAWRDESESNFRIYEIIDIRTVDINNDDIVVDVNESYLLKLGVDKSNYCYYKKRILSILEIKKMVPVKKEFYSLISFDKNGLDKEDVSRIELMNKEYNFCKKIKDKILKKASRIYDKQMKTGIVKPLYCDFKKLECESDKI